MRIINKKYLLIIILVGVILTGVFLFKPQKEEQLNEVVLKDEVSNETFAMYKEEGESYTKIEDNKFPDMYVLNIEKSKCIDNNGDELNGVLSYENDKVVLTTNKSSYCYLYFDKSLGLEIKEGNPKGLSVDKIRGEMYRFQGQAKDEEGNELVDNYICFGTSDKDTCIKDTNHYMYRIIGIEAETGRVKVIKKETLKETEDGTYQWWDKDNEDIKFPDSKIYKAISGNDFLTNTDYVPEGWKEKIATNTWTYGDMFSSDTLGARQIGPELYKTETGKKAAKWYNWADKDTPGAIAVTVGYEYSSYYGKTVYYTEECGNWTESFTGKVSLMYLHDYHYSVSDEANCQYDASSYEICKKGWMHLSNNDSSVSGTGVHEWTMSRHGWYPWGGWLGHDVTSSGSSNNAYTGSSLSVRPVFYLASVNQLSGGSGTVTDPLIIK